MKSFFFAHILEYLWRECENNVVYVIETFLFYVFMGNISAQLFDLIEMEAKSLIKVSKIEFRFV